MATLVASAASLSLATIPWSSKKALSSSKAMAATATDDLLPNTHTVHTYHTKSSTAVYKDIEYLLYLPKTWSLTTSPPIPIILFLHGAGEINKSKVLCRGANGRKALVTDGAWRLRTVPGMLPALVDQIVTAPTPTPTASTTNPTTDPTTDPTAPPQPTFPFILISPQCPKGARFGSSNALMDDLVKIIRTNIGPNFNGDLSNVFVTGLSMGGFGTWSIATRHSTFFKAAAPICGGFKKFHPHLLHLQGVWCFHGANDCIIPVNQSDVAIRQLKKGLEMKAMFGDVFDDVEDNGGSVAAKRETKEEAATSQGDKEGREGHATVPQQRPPIEIKYTRYETSPSPAPNMTGHASWIQAYFESDLLEWFFKMTLNDGVSRRL